MWLPSTPMSVMFTHPLIWSINHGCCHAEVKMWLKLIWPSGFSGTASKIQAVMQSAVTKQLASTVGPRLTVRAVGALVYYEYIPFNSGYTHMVFDVAASVPAGGCSPPQRGPQVEADGGRKLPGS
jgi:hypothetical protein